MAPPAPAPPPVVQTKAPEKSPAVSGVEEAPFAFHPGYANRTPKAEPSFLAKTAPPPAITPPGNPGSDACSPGVAPAKPIAPPPPEKAPPAPTPGPAAPAAHALAPGPAESGPTSDEFDKFLADSPYGRQQRVLLRLIEQRRRPSPAAGP